VGVFVMKKSRGIALKLSSLIIGLFLVLFLSYTVTTGIIIKKQSVEDAEYGTLQTAESSAAIMSERFKKANTTLQTTKRIVESMEKNKTLSTKGILDIMENNLASNDDLLGVGAIFEENSLIVNPNEATLVDSQKRFGPYLSKNDNEITTTLIEGLDDKNVSQW